MVAVIEESRCPLMDSQFHARTFCAPAKDPSASARQKFQSNNRLPHLAERLHHSGRNGVRSKLAHGPHWRRNWRCGTPVARACSLGVTALDPPNAWLNDSASDFGRHARLLHPDPPRGDPRWR